MYSSPPSSICYPRGRDANMLPIPSTRCTKRTMLISVLCSRPLVLLSLLIFFFQKCMSTPTPYTAVPSTSQIPQSKNPALQSLTTPSADPKMTYVPLTGYEAYIALTIPAVSRVETSAAQPPAVSAIPTIKESSLIISFEGMPADEYLDRAKVVYDHRVPAWNLAIGVGGKCSSGTARCSLNLRCVGPTHEEQCHPQVPVGGECDYKYKICKTELVCKRGKCLTQQDAFKSEKYEECGGAEGRQCVRLCGGGKRCQIGVGRKCKENTRCWAATAGGEMKFYQ